MSEEELNVLAQRMVAALERWHAARRCSPAVSDLRQRGLSLSHVRVLHELAHSGRLGMKELAEQLKITPPSLTALMRRLAAEQLVERLPSPHDQRRADVAVSAAGVALLGRLQRSQHDHLVRLLGGLSAEERTLFIELLERAVAQQ
jgi:DNA-binding MarR family transcriptional regulator